MAQRIPRTIASFATAAVLAGAIAGASQAADPPARIPDANGHLLDLNGAASAGPASRAVPVPSGKEMKGVPPDGPGGALIQPSDRDREGGAAARTAGTEGSIPTPIGTLNLVLAEQSPERGPDFIAERPSADSQ